MIKAERGLITYDAPRRLLEEKLSVCAQQIESLVARLQAAGVEPRSDDVTLLIFRRVLGSVMKRERGCRLSLMRLPQ